MTSFNFDKYKAGDTVVVIAEDSGYPVGTQLIVRSIDREDSTLPWSCYEKGRGDWTCEWIRDKYVVLASGLGCTHLEGVIL